MKLRRHKLLSCLLCLIFIPFVLAGPRSLEEYESDLASIASKCNVNIELKELEINDIIINSGWVSDPRSICRGSFIPVKEKYINDSQADDNILFDAEKSSMLSIKGVSYLTGNVNIRYKNNHLSSDKACFYNKGGAGDAAFAEGNVVFARDDFLILADDILWYANGGEYLQNAFFKMDAKGKGIGAAWGRAKKGWSEDKGTLSFSDVTYSYCSLTNPDWLLDAGYLELDKNSRQGFASNLFFRIFGVPVFYLPVFSFPLDSSRKSGFLYPKFSYSDAGGWDVKVPYYWNLAPNYDLTTTFISYVKRGFGWSGGGRFLTEKSRVDLKYFQVFDDNVFGSFKTDMARTYSTNTNQDIVTLTNDLLSDSNDRRFIAYSQKYDFNSNTKLAWNYYWMSDDYMRDDFDSVRLMLPKRKLPRNFSLIFDEKNTFASLNLQDDKIIQTLGYNTIQGVFSALPELFITSNYGFKSYPDIVFNNSLHLLKFAPADGVVQEQSDSTDINVKGTRFLLMPNLKYHDFHPWYSDEFSAGVNSLWYKWHDDDTQLDQDHFMLVPWFSYERNFSFTGLYNNLLHLVKPRFMYNYIPYRNQDGLLVLDSSLPADTYQQLFRVNRFSGYDRLGDTNSITVAIENSWLNPANGDELLKVDIGKNYAINYHKVCLSQDCSEDVQSHDHWSPWQLKASVLDHNIKSSVILSVDNDFKKSNSAYFDLAYIKGANEAKVYYNFVRYLDLYPMNVERSHLVGGEFKAALSQDWDMFSEAQYNVASNDVFGYVIGFHYHSCCFDTKIGWQRRYTGVDGGNNKIYQNNLIFKFYFAGIGGAT
jgi:LPS-assembly protein